MLYFFTDTATTEIYTLSLHDALPISDGDESGKPNAYFTVERQEGVQQIPYVVDFCYGYANWTGWTQDPRPRPFYCSAASIAQTILDRGNDSANIEYYGFIISEYLERLGLQFSPVGDIQGPGWLFYHLDAVPVTSFSEIYHPSIPCRPMP